MHIGFAGVGRMGTHMVRRLLEAGHTVTAYDIYLTAETAPAELVDLGMTITTTPADLARAEISFSMLPDAAATEEVLFGEHGIATAGASEHLHVVMGTVGPTAVREFAERAAGSGTAVVDAPVSGSVSLADTGQITTMVGCDDEQFTYLKPILEAVTRAQFHTGPAGTASVAKLAVNSVLAALNQAVAEALILGESAGLAPSALYEVLGSSAVAAPYVGYKKEHFLDPDAAGVAFPLSLLHKDVGLGLALARDHALDLPQATTVGNVLDRALDSGLGAKDMAAVLEFLKPAES
ncbi:3-hydroxyisobutyrate dehydrogenase [Rhodococcus sp. 06-412-2C]|uniref:NAD(P)-dependent oxidoreductase n=1 Tax=unclassified Rhodococcus (in: high G+C Gram-positive bacteria) TaxID=192944 RepID=UPI000B9AE062|nr:MULTISPECIES: NAD(P)-dependent oxidoreductase [unclassified Rhodococcus (in: high G+C Gram-positive bacteria)]OZC89839.1 3-hydroxyisobutyrate dehydrogenase [Rhodococcus sp. 06-412-2C]OZC93303.1 3-hydroxyisobutyrate dehydrogenase [Rhodococcus sp. 06-412-2B]